MIAAPGAGTAVAEIKVWGPRAIATVLWEIGSQFEHATGCKLRVAYDLQDAYIRRMAAGETFDVFIGMPALVDELIADGKIAVATRTPLVRCGMGVEVRAGAAKPDIASVAAFRRTLLAAKSIAYLKVGGGAYVAGMLERLGIAEAIKSKVTRPDTDIVSELVASGDIELGIVVMTQILTTPGVQLVGPLPPELQSSIEFVGGISPKAPAAARDLLKFLSGPIALPVIKSQGMEPG
jgi:molybdate transport system substrate-binding protein